MPEVDKDIYKNQKLAHELQERLVQCCIDFIREKKLNDVERVCFTADTLHASAEAGERTCYTDSTCEIQGYDINYGYFTLDFSA